MRRDEDDPLVGPVELLEERVLVLDLLFDRPQEGVDHGVAGHDDVLRGHVLPQEVVRLVLVGARWSWVKRLVRQRLISSGKGE